MTYMCRVLLTFPKGFMFINLFDPAIQATLALLSWCHRGEHWGAGRFVHCLMNNKWLKWLDSWTLVFGTFPFLLRNGPEVYFNIYFFFFSWNFLKLTNAHIYIFLEFSHYLFSQSPFVLFYTWASCLFNQLIPSVKAKVINFGCESFVSFQYLPVLKTSD